MADDLLMKMLRRMDHDRHELRVHLDRAIGVVIAQKVIEIAGSAAGSTASHSWVCSLNKVDQRDRLVPGAGGAG